MQGAKSPSRPAYSGVENFVLQQFRVAEIYCDAIEARPVAIEALPVIATRRSFLTHFEDRVDFHGHIARQGRVAHGRAGMASRVTEHRHHDI